MTITLFSTLFIASLCVTTLCRVWLARRQLAHIAAHRELVPQAFHEQIGLQAHHKAADYTSAKTRLSLLSALFDALLLLAFTLGGGIQWIAQYAAQTFASPILQGMATIGAYLLLSALLQSPFDLYRTFVIEARYGFNKMTLALYVADTLKGIALGVLLGLPLLYAVLWLMGRMGGAWWLYVLGVWVTFNLLLLYIYPTFIAPLFNNFLPMQDASLKTRIEALLARCGFTAQGLFVMDGSKRSAHGNAYFTGFGKSKRIVFFDTLLARLSAPEIEAVLAHELGHFKHHHIIQRLAFTFSMSLAILWLLAQLMHSPWFYQGLGVEMPVTQLATALALLLFLVVLPVFSFLLHPLMSAYSRKHEFEADAYAVRQTGPTDLGNALVKMYQDNASTLTPDPLYSRFYDSHPPAGVRIARLRTLQGA